MNSFYALWCHFFQPDQCNAYDILCITKRLTLDTTLEPEYILWNY